MAADVKPDLRRGNRLLEGFWMISPRVRSLRLESGVKTEATIIAAQTSGRCSPEQLANA